MTVTHLSPFGLSLSKPFASFSANAFIHKERHA